MKILIIIFAYLLASIPFSLILGKIFKKTDIRNYGSGNVGATNSARVLGYKIGIATLVLDVLKGFIPVYIASYYNIEFEVIVGLICIIAHAYPIYLKFKGGKAVATTIGVFLEINFVMVLVFLIVFLIVFLLTQFVAIASMGGAISLFIMALILKQGIYIELLSLFAALFIIYRHKSNIINLLNNKEEKFI